MKKTLFAGAAIALAFSAGSAFAADLPSRKAPPASAYVPPPPLWSGFYAGLNAGGTWDASTTTSIASAPFLINGAANAPWAIGSALAGPEAISTNGAGFIGGGQIGYNLQFQGGFLAGLEADIQGVAGSANNAAAVTVAPTPLAAAGLNFLTTASTSKAINYLGTVRGRVGYLITPTLLAYATGGLAYAQAASKTSFTQIIPNDTPGFLFAGANLGQFSDTRVGWTAGGGLEWMFWPNWSAKIEYLYYDLGNVTYPVGVTTDSFLSTLLVANATLARARFDGHVVRAGVNYHFNWGAPAPILAKF